MSHLVPLSGLSPARLSSVRDRRAKTIFSPSQPPYRPSSQGPSSTSYTSYSMKPQSLLSKIQSHASPDQALIQEEVKDSGGTIIHIFNSGMFALVVKPAFSSFSKNYVRVINGHRISLPCNPDYVRDKQGLLVNIKLEFLVNPVSATQSSKVVLHLYSTTTKLMTQGASPLLDPSSTITAAQWFVSNFVLPTIEAQAARSGTSKDHVTAMNKAILRLKPVISQVSSLHHLQALSHLNGANHPPVDIRCALCDALLDGRTKNKKTCDQCNGIFHVKCLPSHLCPPTLLHLPPNNEQEESDNEDITHLFLSPPPPYFTTSPTVPTTTTVSFTSHSTSVITVSSSSNVSRPSTSSVSTMSLLVPLLSQNYLQTQGVPPLGPSAIPFTPSAAPPSSSGMSLTITPTAAMPPLSTFPSISIPPSIQNPLLPHNYQYQLQLPLQQRQHLQPSQQQLPATPSPPTVSQATTTQPNPATGPTVRITRPQRTLPGRSGPALTPDSLDLELSQRALTMCKEELAIKDAQL